MHPILAQTVNVPAFAFDLTAVITWIIIGLIAGFLAGLIVRGRGSSIGFNVVIGLIGALVGGFLFTLLKIDLHIAGGLTLQYQDIVIAFIGAVIVLVIVSAFYRRRRI